MVEASRTAPERGGGARPQYVSGVTSIAPVRSTQRSAMSGGQIHPPGQAAGMVAGRSRDQAALTPGPSPARGRGGSSKGVGLPGAAPAGMELLRRDGEGHVVAGVCGRALIFAAGALAGRGAPWAMTGGCPRGGTGRCPGPALQPWSRPLGSKDRTYKLPRQEYGSLGSSGAGVFTPTGAGPERLP